VATALTAGVAVVLSVSSAQATATPGWRIVAIDPQAQAMSAVSASDAANAWVVGFTGCCNLFVSHWNGKKWETIAAPGNIGGGFTNQVTGASVAAIAGGRAMIFVESTDEELGTSWVDALEWRGRSWSEHAFADLPGDAIASGPDDVWGFGSDNGTPSAEHYNGTSWSQVPIPVSVSQASGNAAAGDWVTGTVAGQSERVVLLHWSNGAWQNAVLPKIAVPAGDQMFPGAVDAATQADIWVTVSVGPSAGRGPVTAVLLHWNGKAWSKVAVPKGLSLGSLASDSQGGAWMTAHQSALVVYHYSGGRWTHAPGPVKSGYMTQLQSDLELIPGTRSVLAAAELFDATSGASEGATLKYGP
jgi:hypothetical protein